MVVPFLSLDERVEYLYDRGYFRVGSILDRHRKRLEEVNFHYFLGYARNFRYLVDKESIPAEKEPDRVFQLIDLDHTISTHAYAGLRKMEWALRNSVTKHYCQKFDPYGSFLEGAQYRELSREYTHEDLVKNILNNTLKHREPFVRDHLKNRANEVNGGVIPGYCDHTNFDRVKDLVSGLPLWAVIDSFSLGVLINFINMCDKGTGDDQIWKLVANDFDVRHRLLGSSLSSARTLRNMVSHHQRLWMRPTPNVPAIPKKLRQLSRRVTNNSVLAPLINISLYQGSDEGQAKYLRDLLEIAESDPNYWFGLAKVDNRA